jgi:hypothetical protein
MSETIPESSAAKGRNKRRQRSRMNDSKSLLPRIDGRTRAARRYRDLFNALVAEFDATAESDMALCRRYASQCVFAEVEEAKQARGEPVDNERLIRSANTIRRLSTALAASAKARRRARRNRP